MDLSFNHVKSIGIGVISLIQSIVVWLPNCKDFCMLSSFLVIKQLDSLVKTVVSSDQYDCDPTVARSKTRLIFTIATIIENHFNSGAVHSLHDRDCINRFKSLSSTAIAIDSHHVVASIRSLVRYRLDRKIKRLLITILMGSEAHHVTS